MIGDLLQQGDRFPLAAHPSTDSRDAAANVLASFLERVVFHHGEERFRLDKVLRTWPTTDVDLTKPSASIDEAVVETLAHHLVPTCLEETYNVHGEDTVLWKTGEQSIDFQVDFYASETSVLTAIPAEINRVFSPTELRYGVMLGGDPCYYSAPVRATLVSSDRLYTADEIWRRDLRLKTIIRCDIDELQLRYTKGLAVSIGLEME